MTDPSNALAATIGARVRRERQARGWTLDRLSAAAGVSRRMLVNVEQGAANPSVGTLLRIGDALGVGLPALVEPPATRPVTVTAAGEGAVLWTGAAGGRGRLVAGHGPPDVLELWDWTLGPGDRHEAEAHAAGTRELLHVLEGSVVLESGGTSSLLGPGDAAAFPGDQAHAYANPHAAEARFSLAVLEPGVGTTTRSEPARGRP
jgi:transcriptional regulator with XRE-family HTH domain